MSTFNVPVVRINAIHPIPGADAIELAQVFGYQSVVKKGDFNVGDLAIYIPEASIVPTELLEEMGLTGKLAGKDKNRVKAIKLRGCVSQGLLMKLPSPSIEGTDWSEALNITKYEPPIPVHMQGEVLNLFGHTIKYDIENILRYPDVLMDGEEIVITEKLHGTFCCLAYYPGLNNDELLYGNCFAFSKGLGSQGLVFKNVENNKNNIYHRTLCQLVGDVKTTKIDDTPVYVFGEIFGPGIQDLSYGFDKPQFRVFDIFVGTPQTGRYLTHDELTSTCWGLYDTVPILYTGPYSKEIITQHRDGKTFFNRVNVREGIVIRPTSERNDALLGRVILKAVSPDYLMRKNDNATEYN